jgi:hypothetical protein
MTNTELDQILNNLKGQLIELESMIAEPSGNFCKSNVTRMFKDNSASARANGSNVLFQAVKEVEVKAKGLMELETMFPADSRIPALKRGFAGCGQHLISMITMMEEWG